MTDHMEVMIPKIDSDKVKRPPPDLYRENMHRHITRHKKRKGASLGLVQELRKRGEA